MKIDLYVIPKYVAACCVNACCAEKKSGQSCVCCSCFGDKCSRIKNTKAYMGLMNAYDCPPCCIRRWCVALTCNVSSDVMLSTEAFGVVALDTCHVIIALHSGCFNAARVLSVKIN